MGEKLENTKRRIPSQGGGGGAKLTMTYYPRTQINRVSPLSIHNLHVKFESDWTTSILRVLLKAIQVPHRPINSNLRLGYCFTPHQRLKLYNGAPLVAFYDKLGIRRTYMQPLFRCTL